MDILICLCKYNENNRQAKEKIPLNLSNIQTREKWQHLPVAWSRYALLRLYRWWMGKTIILALFFLLRKGTY